MTSLIRNLFFGTNIYGKFKVFDNPLGLENADVYFQRDLAVDGNSTLYNNTVKNELSLGTETSSTDSNGVTTYTNTGGNISVKLKGIVYTLTPSMIANISRNMFGNSINSKTLTIRVGVNANNSAVNQVTFDTGTTSDTYQFNGNFSTTNGCTLGDGTDLSRVRRNLNIDNCLRIGYNDTTNVQSGNSNDSKLDVKGNVNITGTIYNSDLTTKLDSKADITYVDTKFNSILGGTLDTTLDTLVEITEFFKTSDNNITSNFTNLLSQKISSSDADTKISNALTTYYTKTETDLKISSIAIPSLAGYATETYVSTNYYQKSSVYTKTESDGKYALVSSIPSLTGYATQTYVTDNYYAKTSLYTKTESDGKYALISSIPSLTGYATETYVSTNYYPKSSVYTKTESDGKYALISSIPSLTGYATQTYVTDNTYSKSYIDTNYYIKTNTYSKTEVDGKIPSLTNYVKISDAPIWTGVHTFNQFPQISSYTAPTIRTQFAPKQYVDDQIATRPTTSNITGTAFNWTKQHTFNFFIPTTTLTPSSNNQFITKIYCDTALNLKANINNPSFTGTVSGITKSMVGLGNVDNTSDINKPVSTATQNALNLKANIESPTFTGTVSGITKDMVGLNNVDNTSDINKPVSTATQNALNLKANIESPTFTGTVSGITKNMVGLGNVDNTSDINKPVSTATQNALNLKANDNNVVHLTNFETITGNKSFLPSSNHNVYGISNNIFNATAISNPPTTNGIFTGTGDGSSFTTFNNSIGSWYGTGFVDTCQKKCNAVIDHRTGDIKSNGAVSSYELNAQNLLKVGNDGDSAVLYRNVAYINSPLTKNYIVEFNQIQSFTSDFYAITSFTILSAQQQISINTPLSVAVSFRNNFTDATMTQNKIRHTLTSVNYAVYRNGTPFASGICSANNNNLPRTVEAVSSINTTSNINYEVYFANVSFAFIPSFSGSTDLYTVYLIPQITHDYTRLYVKASPNFTINYAGMYAHTDVSTKTANISLTTGTGLSSFGTNYDTASYEMVDTSSSTVSGNAVMYVNEVRSNQFTSKQSITTPKLSTTNLIATNILSQSFIPLYVFSGTPGEYNTPYPILASVKNLNTNLRNSIDWYILYPGYMAYFYTQENYDSTYFSHSNTGSTPLYGELPSNYVNDVVSIKIFRRSEDGTSWDNHRITGIS